MNDENKDQKDPNISAITARLFELILQMPGIERQRLLENLEKNQESGKRKFQRKDYFKSVDFATKDRVFRGFIQNISSDGVLIEATGSFTIGHSITLSFELPNNEEHIKLNGEIVRLLPGGGFAVKFRKTIKDFP